MALVKYFKKKISKRQEEEPGPLTPPRAPAPHPIFEGAVASAPPLDKHLTWINFEMDLIIEVVLDPGETESWRIIAPLVNMQIDYKGNPYHKNLWLGLFIIAASGLYRCPIDKNNRVYSIRVRRGIKLGFEGSQPYETNRVVEWMQSMSYLADGLHSTWTVRGSLTRTLINYPPYTIKAGQEDYLKSVGVNCRISEDSELIFVSN
ncbi:matrix protein [Xinjiang tick rhabdovirus]|uniref:Matrix protein n=1 Tax=Xinjiang tick rhabdovirus TaxID=2560016 RepID=A0A482LXC4_9RHAB|nr:matrix protein [Xinjiang tick rhabdovirus]QBQ65044.1 matrix protein [Xinjiang tick rhabdovirus]